MIDIISLPDILQNMGAERCAPNAYKVYRYVSIILSNKTVICKFTPPKGDEWISEKEYEDSSLEKTIQNYFFVGRYLCEISDYKYQHIPFFMQRKYIDRELSLLGNAFDKMNDNAIKRQYELFLKEWEYNNETYNKEQIKSIN